jgi:hypothetical protein
MFTPSGTYCTKAILSSNYVLLQNNIQNNSIAVAIIGAVAVLINPVNAPPDITY